MRDTQLTNLAVNTEADAFASLMDGGFIDIYDGPKPPTGDTPINGQLLGVTLSLGEPAFGSSMMGVIALNPVTPGVIVNKMRAVWGRIYRSDHKTPVMDVSVGVKDANLILPTTDFAPGVMVTCSSFTHTIAKSTPGA